MARTTSSTRTTSSRSRSATASRARSTGSRSAAASTRKPAKQVAKKAEQAEEQVKVGLRSEIDQRSGQFGAQLGSTASDIRHIAGQLRQQDNDSAARVADLAADQIDRAAGYLSSTGADALIEDVERLARTKPWLATGAAALTGFVASRALSASRRERNGGSYVNRDAGSDFDEADAEAAYPSSRRGRS